MRVETVPVQVKMADMITGEYLDSENCIQSVILESELTVVVKAKLHMYTPLDLFSIVYCCFVEEWREYLLLFEHDFT